MFELVGTGTSDSWDRIVLQACQYQGSIRHAVVAIGALSCTLDTSRAEEEQQFYKRVQRSDGRHQFALQKYGCAIVQMRSDMEKGRYDLRTTLICCILAVCFELFEGNHSSALIRATSGLGLINERKNRRKEEYTAGKLENFEESLGDIFVKLDRTARPFALESLFEGQDSMKDEREYISRAPEVFTSCTEAREAWHWTMKSIPSPWGYSKAGCSILERGYELERLPGHQEPTVKTVERELDQLLTWYTSFQPLFNHYHSRISKDTHSSAQAAYLQARHHINLIALTCAQWDDELQYDNFIPLFREIIELSREILIEQKRPTSRRPVFTFDTGVVGFLWVVATKCRDSATRWRAVDVLLEFPTREGRWQSAFVAKGAEAIIRLEEMGVQGTIIPEEARIRAEGVTFELLSRKGKLTYSRLPRAWESRLGKRIYDKVEVFW